MSSQCCLYSDIIEWIIFIIITHFGCYRDAKWRKWEIKQISKIKLNFRSSFSYCFALYCIVTFNQLTSIFLLPFLLLFSSIKYDFITIVPLTASNLMEISEKSSRKKHDFIILKWNTVYHLSNIPSFHIYFVKVQQ